MIGPWLINLSQTAYITITPHCYLPDTFGAMYVAGGEGSIRGALYMSLFRYPSLTDSDTELSVEESSSAGISGVDGLLEKICYGSLSINF